MNDQHYRTSRVTKTVDNNNYKGEMCKYVDDIQSGDTNQMPAQSGITGYGFSPYPQPASYGVKQQTYQEQAFMHQQPQQSVQYVMNPQLEAQVVDLRNDVKYLTKKIRQERRTLILSDIACGKNGNWFWINQYDNDFRQWVSLTLGVHPISGIVKVIVGEEKYTYVGVKSGDTCMTTISLKDMKPDKVYMKLIQAGFQFNTEQIPEKTLRKKLCEYLLSSLDVCQTTIELPEKAGWSGKSFISKESLAYLGDYCRQMELPILKKSFDRVAANPARIKDYIDCLKVIQDNTARVVFALLPFVAIMQSVFEEKGLYEPVVFNFIVLSKKFRLNDFARYLQVFSRNKLLINSADDTERNIDHIISESRDEVLMFEGLQKDRNQTAYRNKKSARVLNRLVEQALGRTGIGYKSQSVQAVLAVFSDEMIWKNGVRNIWIEDDFFDTDASKKLNWNAVDAVYAMFVTYVEYHYDDIQKIILKSREAETATEKYWVILLDIVSDFFDAHGKALSNILGLPEEADFSFLWTEDEMDLEDGEEVMTMAIRKFMPKVYAVLETKRKGDEDCFYNVEYIYFSSKCLDAILQNAGVVSKKNMLLQYCKESGLLVPDKGSNGFTARVQFDNVRGFWYRFKRDSLSQVGQTEIIDLTGGKE